MNVFLIPLAVLIATPASAQSAWSLISRINALPKDRQEIVESALADYLIRFKRPDGSMVQPQSEPEGYLLLPLMYPCAERVVVAGEQRTVSTREEAVELHRSCFAQKFVADTTGKLRNLTVVVSHNGQ